MSRSLSIGPRISRWMRPRIDRAMRSMLSVMVAASVVPMAFAPATAVAAGAVTTSHLYCVDFIDANTGYAAGADGTVVKTTDGGASWTSVRSGDGHEFRGIGFTDASNGWIMSRAGVGFKTIDGGTTWTSLTADIGADFYVGETIYAMARLGSNEAVAVGTITGKPGVGFHKYNGTNSWLSNNFPELMAGTYDPAPELPPYPKDGLGEFYGVDFLPGNSRGWAVGHDRFTGVTPDANAPIIWDYDSSRGSTRWVQQPVTGTGPLYDVAFSSTTQGVAVGSAGKAYRTSNAGGTWTAGTAGSADLFGVELTTSGQGWAVGDSGVIYRSVDNGANWSPLTSPTGDRLEDIEWLANDTAVAVGDAGTIVRTTNGTSWAVSNTGEGTPSPPVMNTLTSSSHPSQTTWVKSTSVSAAWTATAGSSAITGYGVTIDAVASTAPSSVTHAGTSGTLTATGSGKWWLHARAKDADNVWSNTLHREVWVDVTNPVATFSPAASYVGSASVPLTATDAHSGVASVSYKINGGSTTTVAGSSTNVVISTVGTHDVTYWATDNVGNVLGETTKQITVTATTSPVMNTLTSSSHPSQTAWVKSTSVSAAWTATEGNLAITGYGVTIDAVASTAPSSVTHAGTSGTLTATGSGKWWLHARAKDSANVWSNTLHREVWVDVTNPVATFSPQTSYNGSASVPLTATDAHSGVASVSYKIDGVTTTVAGSSTNVVISTVGTHDVTYWATDNVGNVLGETTKQVTVAEQTDPLVPEAKPVSGAGRYATAIESAKLHFTTPMADGPDGEKWVVIASGTNWPDALAASGLAGALEAPLLLTTPDDLRGEVATYITQLGATRAAIVGGEAAVSSVVAADLASLVGGAANVKRYGASSRYATAELIATKTVGVGSRATWDKVAFLSTGGNFPDALAAAPLSAYKGRPLYLALPKTGVSDATIAAMKSNGVERVIVLGGANAVPDSSITRMKSAGITVGAGDRWNGTDRYDTGRVVAENSLLEGLSPERSGLATGENFPDALAGGVAQGLSGSVLVLTQSSVLSTPARTYFTAHNGEIAEIRFFGGTSALTTSVRTAALQAATPQP